MCYIESLATGTLRWISCDAWATCCSGGSVSQPVTLSMGRFMYQTDLFVKLVKEAKELEGKWVWKHHLLKVMQKAMGMELQWPKSPGFLKIPRGHTALSFNLRLSNANSEWGGMDVRAQVNLGCILPSESCRLKIWFSFHSPLWQFILILLLATWVFLENFQSIW